MNVIFDPDSHVMATPLGFLIEFWPRRMRVILLVVKLNALAVTLESSSVADMPCRDRDSSEDPVRITCESGIGWPLQRIWLPVCFKSEISHCSGEMEPVI
jgi:hypothetical protein